MISTTIREVPATEMVARLLEVMGQPCPRLLSGDESITRLDAVTDATSYREGDWRLLFKTLHQDHPVVIGVDFRWCGKPDYRSQMEYRGVSVHVYERTGRLPAPVEVITSPATIIATLDRLAAVADTHCTHQHADHTRRIGNALNEYRCLDCGAVYTVDSSD